MTRRTAAALLAVLLSFAAPAALADPFGTTVMAPGLLRDLPEGTALHFRLNRRLPAAPEGAAPPAGGYRRMAAVEGQDLSLIRLADGGLALEEGDRRLAAFPATSPHPILLMFLENVMRSTAQETGGSPHYIRNVMRQRLGSAETEAGRLRITPFATDRNADRFGAFAALEIDIRWREGNPAELLLLSATLPSDPDRYSEILTSEPRE